MKKGKKPNCNEAQRRAAVREGMDKTMVFCLTALADKMGFDRDRLIEFIGWVAYYAEITNKTPIKYEHLHRVLVEEQGLEW
jgi:hypothetical protein